MLALALGFLIVALLTAVIGFGGIAPGLVFAQGLFFLFAALFAGALYMSYRQHHQRQTRF